MITGKDTPACGWAAWSGMCLAAEDTVRFVGKRWPPSPPSIPTRPKKPSRASTWNTSLFRPSSTLWKRWSPAPPGPRGLAHLCVCVRPHSAAREYPEPRHLVCRRPGARLPRIGPDFRAYLHHHLGAPGLHGALCLRGGYRRRRAHTGVGQQQSALRCESNSPTRWGSLRPDRRQPLWHRRRLRRQVARHERALAYFCPSARDDPSK